MTVLDTLRYATDLSLSIPTAALGLRLFTVELITNQWSGERPGLGTKTQTTVTLTNANNVPVHVRQVSQNDVVVSGGVLRDQDYAVGPLVQPYSSPATGGMDSNVFSPDTSGNPIEVFFRVQGPGMPTGGTIFQKIYQVSDHSICYRLYLRANPSASV
jgi:hypothetical protein